jgi:activator of 2-hydroxyglutaryl-CoA dehydratase
VVDALITELDGEVVVPKNPQIVNAIGAVQYFIERKL